MSKYSAYSTYTEKCPYCGAECEADWVDVGVGLVQCGPFHCENCHAYQLASYIDGPEDTWTEKERQTGWREPAKEKQITCIGCNKSPNEIDEYIEAAKIYDTTPTQYVIEEEGTYNKFLKNKFYCTSCYIKAGQPLIKR